MAFYRCGYGGGGTVTVVPEISGNFGATNGITIQNGKLIGGFQTGSTNRMFYPLTKTGAIPSYDFTKPFTLKIKLQITSSFSGGQLICGPLEVYARADNAGNSFVVAWHNSNNTITYLRITNAMMQVSLNTWYTLTLEAGANGGNVTFTVSDGITTVTVTETCQKHANISRLGFGNYAQGVDLHLLFDFSNTYWEQDGVVIWGNKAS